MRFYKFNNDKGKRITKFNSNFVMSQIIHTDKVTKIAHMHLEVNGVVGYHQAVVPQLLLILNGEGYARGEEDEYFKVAAGDAVYWEKDEWHETKSEKGLSAIVIESEELDLSSLIDFERK